MIEKSDSSLVLVLLPFLPNFSFLSVAREKTVVNSGETETQVFLNQAMSKSISFFSQLCLGAAGGGNGKMLVKGYTISVMQGEYVLEIYYTAG